MIRPPFPDRAAPSRQRGLTLLEALITLVIVSIGLLGILGLQTVSLVNTQTSAARSVATFSADDMADRMRANRVGALDSDYDGIDNPTTEPAACTIGTPCSTDDMAARDGWEWNQRIRENLPEGQGAVTCIETDDGDCVQYRITVLWREREPNAGTTASAPVSSAQCDEGDALTGGCFQTTVRP